MEYLKDIQSGQRREETFVLESERFVSMDDVHIGVEKYKITADFSMQTLIFLTGIDGDVWDINGPHYDEIIMDEDDCISIVGISHEKKYHVGGKCK